MIAASWSRVRVKGKGNKSPSSNLLFRRLCPTDTEYQIRMIRMKKTVSPATTTSPFLPLLLSSFWIGSRRPLSSGAIVNVTDCVMRGRRGEKGGQRQRRRVGLTRGSQHTTRTWTVRHAGLSAQRGDLHITCITCSRAFTSTFLTGRPFIEEISLRNWLSAAAGHCPTLPGGKSLPAVQQSL